ncbi:SAM-dependent methyltransferase [Effusibacillus lacus]|uniref:SAM-dependent methyltransferase n=1 Tax=Effusibacillus lacus TaxID=1348429 RepID=UPI0010455F77|nr:SAM-dependent methyltransferase [Effusibacillus lacus]
MGVYLVHTSVSFSQFSDLARAADPIFTRHIQPVDDVLEINRTKNDLLILIEYLLSRMDRFQTGDRVSVQVRRASGLNFGYTPYGVKEALDPFFTENGLIPVVQQADSVVSIYLAFNRAYIGISKPYENLSDWPGGMIRLQKAENQTSRSRFKLEEACLVFDIRLSEYSSALDLGAAPGGWSSYLLDQGLHVTAVDTGELEPALLNHPNLIFCKTNVSDTMFGPDAFEVLTCDMSWDPMHTAKLVSKHLYSLKKRGIAVITIKLMHKKIRKTIDDFVRVLEPDLTCVSIKQLFHNRDEVTAFFRKT